MKTCVSITSIRSYDEVRSSGLMQSQHELILSAIERGYDYSLRELSAITGIEINSVSGRVNELRKAGTLTLSLARKCSISGRTIHPVCLSVQ